MLVLFFTPETDYNLEVRPEENVKKQLCYQWNLLDEYY